MFTAPFARFAIITATLAVTGAQAAPADVVTKFYNALRKADGSALQSVLADDAVIRLADLGFDMTGEEFVESMDMWSELTPTLAMRVKADPARADDGETVVRIVCYDFGTNQSMTRETSTVVDDRITANMQDEIAESCKDF